MRTNGAIATVEQFCMSLNDFSGEIGNPYFRYSRTTIGRQFDVAIVFDGLRRGMIKISSKRCHDSSCLPRSRFEDTLQRVPVFEFLKRVRKCLDTRIHRRDGSKGGRPNEANKRFSVVDARLA